MNVPGLLAFISLTRTFPSKISACVINARFAKPIDASLIGNLAKEIKCVLTVEENVVQGGFGSAVLEYLSEMDIDGLKIKMLGLPDKFIEHGPQNLLRKILGLDAEKITEEALTLIGKKGLILNHFNITVDH